MIYQAKITIPANTSEANRTATPLLVSKGLVYRVEVFFPAGCSGLAHVQICDGMYQAWPSTPFEYFRGDDTLIAFDDCYLKNEVPYEYQIYCYNDDDTYDHTIDVRIGLVSKAAFMARFMPTMAYDYYITLINNMSEEQRAAQEALLANPWGSLNRTYDEEIESEE